MSVFPDIETLSDAESLSFYGQDWTRFWTPAPERVVFPRSTEDVVALVRWARSSGARLVPSGGRTGLSGGAVARDGEVVVALDKMRRVLDLDVVEPSITVQAGLSVGEVQRIAKEAGLFYPVDWSASGSSQVGGSIATNAGGIRVLRYGMTRQWVRGLEVVDGRGEVLRLNRGLIKNNAGPDLTQVMIGGEGVFGIITEAILGLTELPEAQSVLLVAFTSIEAVMPAFAALRSALKLSAFELFDRRCVAEVASHTGLSFPLTDDAPYFGVVEFDNPDGVQEEAALKIFEDLVEAGQVSDGVLSQSDAQAAELWRWREDISEAITPRTPYKNDLSVRISRAPVFLEALDRLVKERYPSFEVLWFGHIGDGNLHMNVLRPEGMAIDEFRQAGERLSPAVFQLVQQHGGSISAEHGVGLLKRDYLQFCRSEIEIETLRQLKKVFDPDGIMNPGKMLK
ncbi:MAG: FAD-binding oxidoreductase [Wenzhouxiangella sp.]|jgi:FAD/FMN-containing dehydrogenase|nr:FAD-binding oxidoreductase [Wenzhouxiangella sp.]